MKFNYQVKTPEGQSLVGTLEASNRDAALEFLQAKGFVVIALDKADTSFWSAKLNIGFGGIGFTDIMNFTTQLSILFKSSVPLVEALKTIGRMSTKDAMREEIFKMAEKVEGGGQLSAALVDHPKHFNNFYVNMVKAGEASGRLSENLDSLADHLQHEKELRDKITSALVYPIFILFVFIAVLILMVKFIIPQFKQVIGGFGGMGDLPLLTKSIFAVADVLDAYGLMVFIILGAGAALVWRYSLTKEGKDFFDRLTLRIPFVGDLNKKIQVATFAESMSTLIKAGIPISQALEITAGIMESGLYKELVLEVREKVMKGTPMSYVLNQHPQEVPPLLTQMVLVGERTGSLEATLIKVVDFYRRDVYKATDDVVSLIQPVLLLVLGVLVGLIVIGIYYPLINIMSKL